MNTTLTTNELAALTTLAKSCNGATKANVEYLLVDPYTWINAKDLMKAGWSKESAAGTLGALEAKQMVVLDGRDSFITEDGIKYVLAHWQEEALA